MSIKNILKFITCLFVVEFIFTPYNAYGWIMPVESKRQWQAQMYIAGQIKGIGLADSYNEGLDTCYVYDSSLAAISSMLMGNYGLTVEIFNTLTREVELTVDGVPFEYYIYSDYNGKGKGQLYCGNSAWLLQSLNIYQKQRSTKQYFAMQKKLADFLLTLQDPVDGALRGGKELSWKSVEHNIAAYAALRNFGALNNLPLYVERAEMIKAFLTSPAVWDGTRFWRGPGDPGRVTDVQALGVLLLGGEYSSALAWAKENLETTKPYKSEEVTGFDFDMNRDTVWIEGTIMMAMAYYYIGDADTGGAYLSEACKTVQPDGSLLLATNRGSATTSWTLMPYSATAPTSWFIFYYYKFNPLELY